MATVALLLSVGAVPVVHPFAVATTPAIARPHDATGCQIDPARGNIKHVIYIVFDNVHFKRDPDRFGRTNVPSDLEQMPNLYNFIKGNGTLLTNHHTPLISHTSDDIVTTLTGVYPARHGIATAANSYDYYNANGSTGFQTGFTYWTDLSKDGAYNLISGPSTTNPASGTNAPAPWVPYTRAGCDFGGVSTADIELENTGNDINTVFGPNSSQAAEANSDNQQAVADFEGIAVHCAQGSALCGASNSGAVTDTLPSEPGGYTSYNALFGNKYVGPVIAGTTAITDINGNVITNTNGNKVGFPGFNISAAQSLGYVADMQEHNVPVTYAYINNAHNPLPGNGAGTYGPGQAGYVAQLRQYDQAFGKFFQRLAADGINASNTLFTFTSDEEDHFVGENPTPTNCDGVSTPCSYPTTYLPGSTMGSTNPMSVSIGELNANLTGLLQAEQNITTPATINFDSAPDIYLTGNPISSTATTRAFERATAAITLTNPISTVLGVSNTDTLVQYMANPTEMHLLHMDTADPLRMPTFTAFAQPDYYVGDASSRFSKVTSVQNCGASTTPSTACVLEETGFAWNHGDVQPQISTSWLGLVGPGVQNYGVDPATFSDHTDIRPTILSLVGLRDDYTSDGRVLSEDLSTVPPAVQSDRDTYEALARTYKALTAPVGPFGLTTLVTSTQALASGSAGDDSAYTADEAQLTSLGQQRDNLTGQMQTILSSAAFTPTYTIDDAQAQSLIAQGQALLSQVTGTPAVASPSSTPIQHVLLISVDGFHAVDLQNYIATHRTSALTQLAATGVTYLNASTSKPSDSFPGLLSMVTGGTPKSTGVYYDDAYDRSYFAPGTTNCVTTTQPISGNGVISGTEVQLAENIDRDPTRTDAGGGINPSKLPVDSSNCQLVYPHQYLRVNTIFNAIHNAGGRTAWSDKHPAYDLVNGHQGGGVDDLYTPEINGAITVTPGMLQYSNITVATTTTYQAATAAVTGTVAYDNLKVRAILNEINGTGSITPTQAYSVPEIFGMNFQAVSVGQKSPNGGYSDAVATPTGDLVPALDYVNNAIGAMVGQLQAQGLYTSTLVIVTAKHGQAPIDRSALRRIGHQVGSVLTGAGIGTAQVTDDDVALVWLKDRSQTAAAVQALQNMSATIGISSNNQIISGTQLAQQFGDPAFGNGNPSLDPRLPDIIVTPNQGVIYTSDGPTKKISEHGGFNHDDTNVALLVSNPQLAQPNTINVTPVSTTQIAPSILTLLGLNPDALQSVQEEGTQPLPGLTITSTNPLTPTGTPTVIATSSATTGAGTATSTSATATATSTSATATATASAGTATTTAIPATATSTATSSPTDTATNTATNTPTNTATNTPTNTATNTATNTPAPPAPSSTSTPAPTKPPVNTPAPTATPYPTIVLVTPPSGTATATPGPGTQTCHFRLALVYARAIPRHRNHTKGRPVAIVEGLNGADSSHARPYSRTPLFFDDNHGTIIFSRKTYDALSCSGNGKGTLLNVRGTVHYGQAIVRHRKVNLYNAGFQLRVIATGAGRYTLLVDIARINYHLTFTGLQGVVDTRR